MAEVKFGDDMMYPLEDQVAEIHTENSIVFVIRGGMGELDFHTDSVGGAPTVWNSFISSFEELEAIYEFMRDNRELWRHDEDYQPITEEELREEEIWVQNWFKRLESKDK